MILVTGGTGFIGKVLIRSLVENGRQVRTLVRPSPDSPDLPKGISVEVAVSSLNDDRGIRAAMVGLLDPTLEEQVVGTIEVREIFHHFKRISLVMTIEFVIV